MTLIVGFSGKRGAGKTYLANAVAAALSCRVYHFAEPLKTLCADYFDVPREALYGDDDAKAQPSRFNGWTYRHIMQHVGQTFRAVDPDVWVRACLEQIDNEAPAVALIDDVRYRNEAEAIRARGGLVLRVIGGRGDDLHPSETELDSYPHFAFHVYSGNAAKLVPVIRGKMK